MVTANSLQLPAEALERIWRRTGHIVPAELDELILFLKEVKDAQTKGSSEVRKEYDLYVQTCKSMNLIPEEPLSPPKPGNALSELDSPDHLRLEENVKKIPLRFSHLDLLRSVERTLRDIDLLTDVLTKIRGEFSKLGSADGEVRLFLSSSGTDMILRLVYSPRGAKSAKVEIHTGRKRLERHASASNEVQDWITLGVKAVERKQKEEPKPAVEEFRRGWQLEPEVELVWDSTLDSMLRILQSGRLVRDREE